MDNKKKLGQNIKNYRILRGMTQAQLAEAIERTQASIGMYEKGRREPDLDTIEAIAKALNISSLDLMPLDPDIEARVRRMYEQLDEINKGIEELHKGLDEFDRGMEKLQADIDRMRLAFDELERLRGEAGA